MSLSKPPGPIVSCQTATCTGNSEDMPMFSNAFFNLSHQNLKNEAFITHQVIQNSSSYSYEYCKVYGKIFKQEIDLRRRRARDRTSV